MFSKQQSPRDCCPVKKKNNNQFLTFYYFQSKRQSFQLSEPQKMNSVDDGSAAETAATKRARLESKFLRKRFSFHHRRSTDDGPTTAGKPNRCRLDTREKNDRDPATSVVGEERESIDQPEKVAQEMDDEDKALERLVFFPFFVLFYRSCCRSDSCLIDFSDWLRKNCCRKRPGPKSEQRSGVPPSTRESLDESTDALWSIPSCRQRPATGGTTGCPRRNRHLFFQ